MAIPISTYSVLTTGAIVASSSGSGYYTFGFPASEVRFDNLGSVQIWAKFDVGATAASTSDLIVSSCSEHQNRTITSLDSWRRPQTVTIFTTSTVAGTAQFGISAIG